MAIIASIASRVIKDSRSQPTVEVTVTDDRGRLATASIPGGSSVGKYEPVSIDASAASNAINTTLAPALLRMNLDNQASIDKKLQQFDPTPDRQKLGVNTTLAISLASARLMAQIQGIPLYQYIQTISSSPGFTLPTPMFNLINGGKHAENNLDFQEYMIVPMGLKTFYEKLSAGKKVFASLGRILQSMGYSTEIGYEGGYAPNLSTNEEGLGLLVKAIQDAGYTPGSDVLLGVDVAASALPPTFAATTDNYLSLFENFPLLSLEDPFSEDAWADWSNLKVKMDKLADSNHPRLLVGDDLFVSNKDRLLEGINKYVAHAILIKLNQAATLSEVLEAISLAREHKYVHILSHRSGETLDTFVSDVAVGTASAFIKAGSPSEQAPERITKYERIAEIEEELTMVHQ